MPAHFQNQVLLGPFQIIAVIYLCAATLLGGAQGFTLKKTLELEATEARPFAWGLTKAARNGGFINASQGGPTTNLVLRRLAENGEIMWTNGIPEAVAGSSGVREILETADGEFLVLGGVLDPAPSRLWRFDGTGQWRQTIKFDPELNLTLLVHDRDQYLVGGTKPGRSAAGVSILRLAHDLSVKREQFFEYGGNTYLYGLVAGDDESYAFGTSHGGLEFVKVDSVGSRIFGWRGQGGTDQMRALLSTRDGSYWLAGGSDSTSNAEKQAPPYGGRDYWIIKATANGTKLWDRSFGGSGHDDCEHLVELQDGTVLAVGRSLGSGTSGNKTLGGDGIWVLRLDPNGIKMEEFLFPYYLNGVTTRSEKFSILASLQTGASQIIDVGLRTGIRLSTSNPTQAYAIDISNDLINWTPLVTRVRGAFELSEELESGRKFFRTRDVP